MKLPLPAAGDEAAVADHLDEVDFARSMLESIVIRRELLGDLDLGDPTWFIVVELFVRHSEGSKSSVSSICDASGSPPTTALRHIERLVEQGYIRREPDSMDRRRVHLSLSPEMVERVRTTLRRCLDNLKRSKRRREVRPFVL